MTTAQITIVIAGAVLLLQLYRFIETFSLKKETTATALRVEGERQAVASDVRAALVDDRNRAAETALRIETALNVHRTQVETTLEGYQARTIDALTSNTKTMGEILEEAKKTNGRLRAVEDWQLSHETEDRAAYGSIAEMRDLLMGKKKRRQVTK